MLRLAQARFASRQAVAVLAVLVCAAGPGAAQERGAGFADPLLGRWDLTVETPNGPYPSWLEVRLRTETELMGRFVGRFGSVRHVARLTYDDGQLAFAVPVQYEPQAEDLRFEGTLAGDVLEGTTTDQEGRRLRWTGLRAPALQSAAPPAWAEPIALFNGRDLSGWRTRNAAQADCWRVASGLLSATPPCVDLVTERAFEDFKLRVELRYPPGSNSGIYLRGRYEVQIQDDAGKALDALRMGGVYGFLTPAVDAARNAGEWQTLEVTLIGRRVTVNLNGTTIIEHREIPGITGGALDSDEAAAGPIMLQGDHGPIEFRDITLTPRR
jgi:hypothetical protein